MFKVNNKDDVIDVVVVSSLLTLTYFAPFATTSIADFKQVNVYWGVS